MYGELVYTAAADGQPLHGFLITGHPPPFVREEQGEGPAVLHIHDLYATFYTVPYLADLARHLQGTGVALLSANIRYDAPIHHPPPLIEGPGEGSQPADAQPDLAAWLDWLTARGYQPIFLVGHGVGGAKIADYVVSDQDQRVGGVVFVAPPDQAAWTKRLGQRLDEAMAWALLMLEAGQADEVIRIEGLGPLSARAVRDLFGLRGAFGRFNYAERGHDWGWLAHVRVPLLLLHTNADDLSRPVADIAKLIQRHATAAPSVSIQIVAPDAIGAAIAAWPTGLH